MNRRKRFVGADTKWIILEEMIFKPKGFFDELQVEKAEGLYRAKPTNKGRSASWAHGDLVRWLDCFKWS